ncbi:MAG: diguanylate cyclase [Gallionellaceae bacterium]|jgi:diguanylate cyclase (GGDEF)-like protein
MDKQYQAATKEAEIRAAIADPGRLEALRRTSLLDTPPEESFDHLTRLAAKLTGAPVTFVSLVDLNRDFYKSTYGFGEPLSSVCQVEGRTLCHFSILEKTPLVINDVTKNPLYNDVPTVKSMGVCAYAGVPLVTEDGQVLGSFCAIDSKPKHWSELDIEILSAFAHSVMREINLRKAIQETISLNLSLVEKVKMVDQMNQKLEVLATTDSLTGLLNRRAFEHSLGQALAIVKRRSSPLSVLIIDVDHFKLINDNHGHATGDHVLRTIATLLTDSARNIDVVGRIGGEEFAVILPDTDKANALEVAERMRVNVANADWSYTPLTISLGIATLLHGENASSLLVRADKAMYSAKKNGRNRVVQA